MKTHIRNASLEDLDFLVWLEKQSFPPYRQCSRHSLRTSILSPKQSTRIIEALLPDGSTFPLGAAIIISYKHTRRIFTIVVHPDFRSMGYGTRLLRDAIKTAKKDGYSRASLEADARNPRLISWYLWQGFYTTKLLCDYYAPGHAAYRMHRLLSPNHSPKNTATLPPRKNPKKQGNNVAHMKART